MILTVGEWGGRYKHPAEEARDVFKQPAMHRTVAASENDPAPNVSSAKAEKLCLNQTDTSFQLSLHISDPHSKSHLSLRPLFTEKDPSLKRLPSEISW